jgi:hypothetical protein
MNHTHEHTFYYEDDFPLDFDTGFTLFITAICIVGFLYAVWVAMYTKIIGCGICAFVAAASAVCATWGGTARTKEVNSFGNWTAIGFGVFVFIWWYIYMINFVSEKREQRSQSYLENGVLQHEYFYLNVSAIATLLALIPGMVVLAVYCKRMNEVEQYEYYGPMYISGYQTELYHWYDGGTCRYFHGQLNVSWGMEWGCPDYTDRWCSDAATDHECTKDVCHYPPYVTDDSTPSESGNDDECGDEEACPDGQQAAEQCIIDKYELYDWLDALQSDYHDYNRNEAPEEATTDWPQAIVYGNCDTCKAKVEVPLESAQDLKPIGIGLTLGGLVTDTLLVCVLLFSRAVLCKKTRQVSQSKPSTTSVKDGKTPVFHFRV